MYKIYINSLLSEKMTLKILQDKGIVKKIDDTTLEIEKKPYTLITTKQLITDLETGKILRYVNCPQTSIPAYGNKTKFSNTCPHCKEDDKDINSCKYRYTLNNNGQETMDDRHCIICKKLFKGFSGRCMQCSFRYANL
jgi:hypothetical protein